MEHLEIFEKDPFFEIRRDVRFPQDTFYLSTLVSLSHSLGISLLPLNAMLAAGIYLGSFISIYMLGLFVLKSPRWSFVFGLLVSQCTYASWLRYPIFVPKMLGFMLYPLVLLTLIRTVTHKKGYGLFALVTILALVIYPPSVLYYFPIFLGAGLLTFTTEWKLDHHHWAPMGGFFLVATLVGGVMWLIKLLRPDNVPVPLYVADYLWSHHKFFFPKTLMIYFKEFWDYLIFSLGSLLLLYRHSSNTEKRQAFLLMATFSGCLLVGVASHILAVHIAEIRMLWFWRVTYYAYVPALLLVVLALQILEQQRHKIPKLFFQISSNTLIVFLLIWIIVRTPATTDTLKGTLQSIQKLSAGIGPMDKFDQEMAGLVKFISTTPESSIFLLPHRRYQTVNLDFFEAEALRRPVLSRMEAGFLAIQNKYTLPYYKFFNEYDEIENLENEKEFQERLGQLANKTGATHIIHPASHKFRLTLPLTYQDAYWLVYFNTRPELPQEGKKGGM